MRIVLVSSFVPFIKGGARFIVEWLETKLKEHGHEVERFYLPFSDHAEDLLDQITAYRLMDLSQSCDRLIAFRPPAYVIEHPNKVLWFIHHIRTFYDLWDSPYRATPDTLAGRSVRQALIDLDTRAFGEARRIFTNSQIVADRLQRFNGIASTPLYPPILDPERFRTDEYGDEVLVICRVEPYKRQRLLVEAMKHVKTNVRLRLCGQSSSPTHSREIQQVIARSNLEGKVIFEDRWISEEEKVERLASALAVAYLPLDEDSYGYPSLEAAHARKGILTTTDSGGVLELVEHNRNGLVVAPDPVALAEALDRLYLQKSEARRFGEGNLERIGELNINWPHVVEALTA